ncbi:hypothetical protein VTL71DRAFT_6738 [Oculimacula yallundae]|uniref:Uncharacterized protein n=1 Tax=Oculimacula yallundae TaxID=86028 RepID=A0ABR4BYH4_9HELO
MASECELDDNSDPPEDLISVRSDAGVFSFDGYQLKLQEHPYAKDVAQYIPLLEPSQTKKDTIAARHLRHNENKPRSWWQSQCIFRGLSSDGDIEVLQNRLRGHEEDPISDEILGLLGRAREQSKANTKEKERNWLYRMSDDEKAIENPRRFLKEAFFSGSRSKKTVLLTTPIVASIQDTAEQLGLGCEYTDAPSDGDAVVRMAKYWVVIGQDRSAVTEEIRMIERETQRLKREREDGRQELRRKNKMIRATQMESEEVKANSKDWDVLGLWNISCPQIEDDWGMEDLTMKIYSERTEKGCQMFAEFDFGVLTGVLRFERQKSDPIMPLKQPVRSEDDDRKENEGYNDAITRQEEEEDNGTGDKSSDRYDEPGSDDDENNEQDDRRSHTPEEFYFRFIPRPSPKYPTWNFRYRGESTDEGVIEEQSDCELYSITFCGSTGWCLSGEIGGTALGKCSFTGVKVGVAGNECFDIRRAWRNWQD